MQRKDAPKGASLRGFELAGCPVWPRNPLPFSIGILQERIRVHTPPSLTGVNRIVGPMASKRPLQNKRGRRWQAPADASE